MESNSSDLRMRTATVLWRLEQSLGTLVKRMSSEGSSLPEGQVKEITRRELEKGDGQLTPNDIVAATYLDEVLDLAVDTAENRAIKDHLEHLRNISRTLDLSSIRNAVAHPNRPFPRVFWYRMAAIATDPVIEKIGFTGVTETFESALKGEFETPPEEWIEISTWEIPNNLPNSYDFEITGFIGRKEEKKDIKKRIKNERIPYLAIVGHGGVGKTALLLHVLDEIVKSPEFSDTIDEVLYVSAKTEVLTKEGVKELDTTKETIDDIKESVSDTLLEGEGDFEDAKMANSEKDILLCIDNLETILRDEEEEFRSFYLDLPKPWMVIVTSRVTVDAASIISIDNLDETEAINFARIYLRKRGVENIEQDVVEKIVQNADSNPLAIRLSIDYLVSGGTLREALSRTQENVVQFSYQNLINQLSSIAKEVLECLFKAPRPVGRVEVAQLLDRSIDDVAEGFKELLNTSLCSRKPSDEVELYELSSSVRDLLLVEPADIEARKEIEERRRDMKQTVFKSRRSQTGGGDVPLSRDYLSENLPPPLRATLYEASRVLLSDRLNRREALRKLKQIEDIIDDGTDYPELYRLGGLLLVELGSRERGKDMLKKAISGDSFDPAAALSLCIIHRKDNEYGKAVEIGKLLMTRGWGKPSQGKYMAKSVVLGYYLPRIRAGDVRSVAEETKDWKSREGLSNIYGSIRLQALRRLAQNEDDESNSARKLVNAVEVIDELFRKEGYPGHLVYEGAHIIRQISNLDTDLDELSDNVEKISSFIDDHLTSICDVHERIDIYDTEVKEWIKSISDIPPSSENLVASKEWTSFREAEDEEGEYVLARVKHIPSQRDGTNKEFLFATEKSSKRDLFIHISDASNVSGDEWRRIKEGDKFRVIPGKKPEGKSAHSVKHAKYLE